MKKGELQKEDLGLIEVKDTTSYVAVSRTKVKDLLKKLSMESFRFYISGQNLLIIDAKSFTGVDPENAGFGYPQPTTFTAGLNFTL